MDKYLYSAYDTAGRLQEGFLHVSSEQEAVNVLKEREWLILKLQKSGQGKKFSLAGRFVTGKEHWLAAFCYGCAAYLQTGMTLPAAVSRLAEKNSRQREMLENIAAEITAGNSLADSLDKYRKFFSSSFIALLRAGETSGNLEIILLRLAEQYEEAYRLQQKLKTIMIYPVLVLCTTLVMAYFLLTFVLPVFAELFQSLDLAVPPLTSFLLSVGQYLLLYQVHIMAFVLAGVAVLFYLFSLPAVRYEADRVSLKLPVLGSLRQQYLGINFMRTTALLLGSGITAVDALQLVKDTLGNFFLAEKMAAACTAVEAGENMSLAMKKAGGMPDYIIHSLSLGEETGEMENVLQKQADFYEHELKAAIEKWEALIEPCLLLLVGAIVGFFILAVVLPLFRAVSMIN